MTFRNTLNPFTVGQKVQVRSFRQGVNLQAESVWEDAEYVKQKDGLPVVQLPNGEQTTLTSNANIRKKD